MFDIHYCLVFIAMKVYSGWPTFPQLYAKGNLVGGADIMLEMHQNGELVELFSDLGLHSKLLDEAVPTAKK